MDISPENLTAGKWNGACTINVSLTALPEGYSQVTYIQSDSNQYINTGYVMEKTIGDGNNYIIDCKFTSDSGYADVYGFCSGLNINQMRVAATPGRVQFTLAGSVDNVYDGEVNELSTQIAYIDDSPVIYVNGSDVTVTSEGTAFENGTGLPIYLFTDNYAGSASSTKLLGKIYSFSIEKNGVTEVNMVPCIKDSTGEVGMYDTVRKQFYGNSGTGAFTYGTSN